MYHVSRMARAEIGGSGSGSVSGGHPVRVGVRDQNVTYSKQRRKEIDEKR